MKRITVLCFWLVCAGRASAVYKRWLPDTNFENPDNWNPKRMPCGRDVVVIPEESPVVYMQFNTTLKELELPLNGELILGQNTILGFTESPVDGCQDTDESVEFAAFNPKPWFDPANWCTTPTQRGSCDFRSMILDVEKVPCTYDDVVFPPQHSYFVDLTENVPASTVKSFRFYGTSLPPNSLISYLTSKDGQKMFRLPAGQDGTRPIRVSRKSCDDVRGCACGNDRTEIAKKICAYAKKTCKRLRCREPIHPRGACCGMCGAMFNITRGYGFSLEAFKTELNNSIFTSLMEGVSVTFSVTSEGWLQLLLAAVTGQQSSALAGRIQGELINDIANGGHKYAIDHFQLFQSYGDTQSGAQTGAPMSSSVIAGIVVGVIIGLLLLVFVLLFYLARRTGRTIRVPKMLLPTLPRLPRRRPRAMARVLPGVPQTASHIDPGFANPLYDTSPFDDDNAVLKEMQLIETSRETQPTFDLSGDGFTNPLYGEESGTQYQDPTQSQDAGPSKDVAAAAAAVTSEAVISLESPGDSTL